MTSCIYICEILCVCVDMGECVRACLCVTVKCAINEYIEPHGNHNALRLYYVLRSYVLHIT